MSSAQKVLIYLLRRDLRLADNPVFTEVARLNAQSHKPFTHLLPIYVFSADQIEVSGFLPSGQRSPYKEARGRVSGFWRCGKLRARFIAESVWDLKQDLQKVRSDLVVRAGTVQDVVKSVLESYRGRDDAEVHGLWMTSEEGWEEKREEAEVKDMLHSANKEFKLFTDEKYFVDDRDIPFSDPKDLSDVFTTYRKTVEPLREAPRKELPRPDTLPALPDFIPPPHASFEIPDDLFSAITALHKPLDAEKTPFPDEPTFPENAQSAHPFEGGSHAGHNRIKHLIESGSMSSYKDTRNGLLGLDFSTKLSAWLALGCITARQVHWRLIEFEDGTTDLGKGAKGYGQGENKGTAAVRFELLWRDYMRLCTRKFGVRLFELGGYRDDRDAERKFISSPYTRSTKKKNSGGANDGDTLRAVERFLAGRTGTGLIDASQRELWCTGWTSNRARQNVASFLSKHMGVDWRLGAEWYEMNLVDYDVSSNWGNWQYVAGVGNDPRGDSRVFNPVKQAVDYDKNGEYVRTWVPELKDVGRSGKDEEGGVSLSGGPGDGQGEKAKHGGEDSLESLMGVFQAWRMPAEEKKRLGLEGVEWVEKPLIRINFSVNRRGGGGGSGGQHGGRGGSRGRGGGGRGRGRGRGDGGKGARSGQMEKAGWQG